MGTYNILIHDYNTRQKFDFLTNIIHSETGTKVIKYKGSKLRSANFGKVYLLLSKISNHCVYSKLSLRSIYHRLWYNTLSEIADC